MSHSIRQRSQGPAPRRRREFWVDSVESLEERQLLTPVLATGTLPTVTFTAAPTPTNAFLGTVSITTPTGVSASPSASPVTSVSELTPSASFGGDIVRIKAGPGGVFGSGVYAISRGAGGNTGAVNRPGVIYRVDPATGKATTFFDLNTVISQLEGPTGTAANSAGASTGLVNWYDMAFDKEGVFDGKPSLFVSSVDTTDPNKNVIYRIAPDGTFMGAFTQYTSGASTLNFNIKPTAILIPQTEQQSFLNGLIAGSGGNATPLPGTTGPVSGTSFTAPAAGTTVIPPVFPSTFAALLFNATSYSPGQVISNANSLPTGVTQTPFDLGPQVGFTSANIDYASPVYDVFTDFGTAAAGGIPAQPGYSGVQGLSGELLIANAAAGTGTTAGAPQLPLDQQPLVTTPFRRFEDISFDQYGYFSQAFALAATTGTTTTTTTLTTVGNPTYAGSVFVADLATGLSVNVTPIAPLPTAAITVPVQGPGPIGVTTDAAGNVVPIITNGNTTGGSNLGGRILRIDPNGRVTEFATGFNTSGDQGATSFINSAFSISFSADGTTLYAADNDGIWQFKTVTDLASATSGSIVGLNDLRTLGVPYDGQDTAVAVVDTGVDQFSTPFRGRVAPGTNVVTNGAGTIDFAPNTAAATTGTGGANGTGVGQVIAPGIDGHGTLIAGVVAQFVPQATIVPITVFYPFLIPTAGTTTGTGGTGTGTGTGTVTAVTNAAASTDTVYDGINYLTQHPFVADPVRANHVARITTATFGFGTTETFPSEGQAYKRYPQIVISLKNEMRKLRALGIAPIAAAGQFGAPFAAGVTTTGGTGRTNNGGRRQGTGGTGTTVGGAKLPAQNNSGNTNAGDSNGMSLPAVLNEAVSVTGTIPFPFSTGPNTPPINPPIGVAPSPVTPLLMRSAGVTQGTSIYANRILASANRGVTTDYAAPALDIPTFRRTFITGAVTGTGTGTGTGATTGSNLTILTAGNVTPGTTTTTTTTTTGTLTTAANSNVHLTFTQGGTSLAAGIVAGSFDLLASALDYWSNLSSAGYTSDAYLTQPVGARTLNFGQHVLKDLSAYNNPDGINAILAWTAVPASDPNDGLSASTPPYQFGSTHFRNYSEINVGNAVAAIEGEIAIQYLLQKNIFPIIDTNHNGLITAQEIQNFVDNSSAMGLPEAGAMARLLGGTARIPTNDFTQQLDQPDQPDVLQRRFNFFDYAAHGQLQGALTMNDIQMLSHTLLPSPDAFTINDRQRASANGYLLDPNALRNFHELQHITPRFEFVPKGGLLKYRNISPARFKVNRYQTVSTSTFPVFTLFDVPKNGVSNGGPSSTQSPGSTTTGANSGSTVSAQSTGSTTTGSSGASSTGGTTTSGSTTGSTATGGSTSSTSGSTGGTNFTGTTGAGTIPMRGTSDPSRASSAALITSNSVTTGQGQGNSTSQTGSSSSTQNLATALANAIAGALGNNSNGTSNSATSTSGSGGNSLGAPKVASSTVAGTTTTGTSSTSPSSPTSPTGTGANTNPTATPLLIPSQPAGTGQASGGTANTTAGTTAAPVAPPTTTGSQAGATPPANTTPSTTGTAVPPVSTTPATSATTTPASSATTNSTNSSASTTGSTTLNSTGTSTTSPGTSVPVPVVGTQTSSGLTTETQLMQQKDQQNQTRLASQGSAPPSTTS